MFFNVLQVLLIKYLTTLEFFVGVQLVIKLRNVAFYMFERATECAAYNETPSQGEHQRLILHRAGVHKFSKNLGTISKF
jgi:hypothetical protein